MVHKVISRVSSGRARAGGSRPWQRREQGREALGPFEEHHGPAGKDVVEAEALDLTGFVEPIEIDVINRRSFTVLVNERA